MENNKRLFRRLSEYFKNNIKLSFFDKFNILIVTKEDKVYQFDEFVKDTYSILAFTSDELMIKSMIENSIHEGLCNKGVIDFKCGYSHTIARTSNGKAYFWGQNNYGVIGNGLDDPFTYEPMLNEYLNDLNIIDMSCGAYHSLVLTSNGDIYAWGDNESGQIGNGNDSQSQLIPFKINYSMNEKFKAISCGAFHSMALTESGRVFSWGDNEFGQLGHGSFSDSNQPKLIEINVYFQKICGCFSFSILLSTDGEIYYCGGHNGEEPSSFNPRLIKKNHSRNFCDIATAFDRNFFAALSEDGFYYIWGKSGLNAEIITKMTEIPYKCFNEIFSIYCQIAYKSVEGGIIEFEDGFIRNKHWELDFNLKEKLGEGSFGEVFKVNHKNNEDKIYAIKRIKIKNEKDILKEFQIFSLISTMKYKNVVRYKDVWLENNFVLKDGIEILNKNLTLYLQMEFCEMNLDDFLIMIERLVLEETHGLPYLKYYISSALFIDILEGVNYLHKHKPQIIHRDLRPDNILLKLEKNDKLVVKIADFGLVTIHNCAEQLHEPDKGHIRYIAPEVGDGGKYDTKADIYSLGMILKDLYDVDPDNW
jgi:RCC1 and BTB domain-containing protein